MKKLIHRRLIVPAALLAVGAGVYFVPGLINGPEPEEVALSTIAEHIEAGDVTAATLSEVDRSVTVTLTDGVELTSNYVGAYGETLTEDLLAAGVDAEVDAPPGKSWLDYLGTFVTLLLFAPLIFLILSQSGGLKRSRHEVGEVPTTRFSDVAGMDEAVEEMKELVEFLRDGKRFSAVGARPPKGALLYGPPGTGKTLLARAVAGEAGVPFFQATGSDFDEIFVGVGASRIRSLFKRAKEAGRAIIFIDEIDSVGRSRTDDDRASTGSDKTLTALLTQMQGFESTDVIVIGATNLPDVIDPALKRRLEREIAVPLPDRRGRTAILQVHAKGKPFADDVDWVKVGQQAFGMSGADLEKVVNEAAMEAARGGESTITQTHVYAALSTIQVGRARTSAIVTDRDRTITAWHEAGHALVATIAEHVEDPTYVTIIPRGGSGGHTRPGGNDHQLLSRPEALDQLAMMMGGRAAEIMLLGPDGYTQAASSDLEQATRIATAMVTQYGMGSQLVQVDPDALRVGGEVAIRVQNEVDQLLRDALFRAQQMLRSNSIAVRKVVDALLEHETLTGAQIKAILAEANPIRYAAPMVEQEKQLVA